jgi:hypothetical protein
VHKHTETAFALAVKSSRGELVSAWDQLLTRGTPHDHIVQFYDRDEALLVTKVGHYLREGWKANDALVAVGTAQRNLAIADTLSSLGVDVAGAVNSGRLLFFDAHEMLERLTPDGQPKWGCFDSQLGSIARGLRARGLRVRAYGEMVGILWARGQYDAAMQLEGFWNRLICDSGISLFCAYPIDVLAPDLDKRALDAVLCAHTHLLPVGPNDGLDNAVKHAMQDVLGERSKRLRKIVDTYFRPARGEVPKAEGMVFWLLNNLPQYADRILDRARAYYRVA